MLASLPPSFRRAAILDIGSASIRILIARHHPGQPLEIECDQGIITRLMSGLTADSFLSDESMNQSFNAIGSLIDHITDRTNCVVRCIGTQALRRARNADYFIREVERIGGFPVEVITADREGRLAWLGSRDLLDQQALLMDLGGGSTELVFYDREGDLRVVSLPVGAAIHEAIPQDLEFPALSVECDLRFTSISISRMVCLGGTATSVAFIAAGIEQWAHGCVHGMMICRRDIEMVRDRVSRAIDSGLQQRLGIEPGRIQLLPSGIRLLLEMMNRIGVDSITVSEHGIRFGLVREILESGLRETQAALCESPPSGLAVLETGGVDESDPLDSE